MAVSREVGLVDALILLCLGSSSIVRLGAEARVSDCNSVLVASVASDGRHRRNSFAM